MSMPPDPNAQPQYGAPTPPPPPPAQGYVPPQYTPQPASAYPGGAADPLVLPPGASYQAWLNKVLEVLKRSWLSALIISAIGIALPAALTWIIPSFVYHGIFAFGAQGDYWGSFINSFFDGFNVSGGNYFLFLLLLLISFAGAAYIAAAGWSGGVYAIVHEAAGQKVSPGQALSYGMRRAKDMWLWVVIAGVIITVAYSLFVIPFLIAEFLLSMFGFATLFERSKSPLMRSVQLTTGPRSSLLAPRVGTLIGVVFVYNLIINAITHSIAVSSATSARDNLISGATLGNLLNGGSVEDLIPSFVGSSIMLAIVAALFAIPTYVIALTGLTVTYAEARAADGPTSTAQLQAELG